MLSIIADAMITATRLKKEREYWDAPQHWREPSNARAAARHRAREARHWMNKTGLK